MNYSEKSSDSRVEINQFGKNENKNIVSEANAEMLHINHPTKRAG